MKLDSFIQIDIPIQNSIHRGLFPISNDIIPILDIKCWIFHCHVSDCQRVYRQKWPCRKRMTHWMEWGSLFYQNRDSVARKDIGGQQLMKDQPNQLGRRAYRALVGPHAIQSDPSTQSIYVNIKSSTPNTELFRYISAAWIPRISFSSLSQLAILRLLTS